MDWKEPHEFAQTPLYASTRQGECVCGLLQENPLHASINYEPKSLIPKLAVEQAIAGGWDGEWGNVLGPVKHLGTENDVGWKIVSLDPTFWQALGKSLGWPEIKMLDMHRGHEQSQIYWLFVAHRFYDLILQKEDTAEFWQELLKC